MPADVINFDFRTAVFAEKASLDKLPASVPIDGLVADIVAFDAIRDDKMPKLGGRCAGQQVPPS